MSVAAVAVKENGILAALAPLLTILANVVVDAGVNDEAGFSALKVRVTSVYWYITFLTLVS